MWPGEVWFSAAGTLWYIQRKSHIFTHTVNIWTHYFLSRRKEEGRKGVANTAGLLQEQKKNNVLCSNSSSRKTIQWLNAERFNFYPVPLDIHSWVHDIKKKSSSSECIYSSTAWNEMLEEKKNPIHHQQARGEWLLGTDQMRRYYGQSLSGLVQSETPLSLLQKHPPGTARKEAGNKEDSEQINSVNSL